MCPRFKKKKLKSQHLSCFQTMEKYVERASVHPSFWSQCRRSGDGDLFLLSSHTNLIPCYYHWLYMQLSCSYLVVICTDCTAHFQSHASMHKLTMSLWATNISGPQLLTCCFVHGTNAEDSIAVHIKCHLRSARNLPLHIVALFCPKCQTAMPCHPCASIWGIPAGAAPIPATWNLLIH